MPFLRLDVPPAWTVQETEWNPSRNEAWESLFTLSNGYVGIRGFPEEAFDAGPTDPGIYLAGVFNPGADGIPEQVNATNFLAVEILLGGRLLRMGPEKVTQYSRVLGLKRGLLQRSFVYTEDGRSTRLEFERFASMSNMHLVGQSLTLTPLDWQGEIRVQLWLDARAQNHGTRRLKVVHSEHMGRDRILVATQTETSLVRIAHACRCSSWVHEGSPVKPHLIGKGDRIGFEFAPALEQGQRAAFERLISTYTSRDRDTDSVERGCLEDVRGTEGGAYGVRRRLHVQAWQRRWDRANIEIDGPEEDQRAVGFAVFQLIQHTPPHDLAVSIAAKGLTGDGYRGHVFWDTEIFMLPFFVATNPPAARLLLRYRTSTIEGAKRKARALGFEGAMFAWESADTGDETCPPYVTDPKTGAPVRVLTGDLQHHVSADVVYAAWQYVQATGDTGFRERALFQLAVHTARFWASRAVHDPSRDRYEIRNVIGPDEYHEQVNNNAFTNYIAAWNLRLAAQEVERMREVHPRGSLLRRFGLRKEEVQQWTAIAGAMYLPAPSPEGVWEQHEGFFGLRDADPRPLSVLVSSVPENERLEQIHQAQILKQADVVMLAALFPGAFSEAARLANWNYYEPRTTHDSSLSPSIHSIVASDLELPRQAYAYFRRSALLDLDDTMGNTNTGLHLAALGGTWQAVVRGFLGLDLAGEQPRLRPRLPESWRRVCLQIQHRGRWYHIESARDETRVALCLHDTCPPPTAGAQESPAPADGPRVPDAPGRTGEPMTTQGVIFDLDGVIVSTDECHYQAWKRMADEEGLPFSRTTNRALRGVSRIESLNIILKEAGRRVSQAQKDRLAARKNRYYGELIERVGPVDILPGVMDLLRELKRRGVKIAVASSSKNAPRILQRIGLQGFFDATVDGNAPVRSKPFPDLFLAAARSLGLPPRRCVVVEDARAGVTAAHNAGMAALAVGDAADDPRADMAAPDLAHVSAERLMMRRRERREHARFVA